MATTELHKVPETILSRCQEFEFRTIPIPKIFDRLKLIADAETIVISDDALRELARSGEGSMRDAQSNFDQVISFSGEEISSADVNNALGFAGVEILSKTINAISERQATLVLNVVDDLIARGHDLRNFCRDLLGLFRDLLVFKIAGENKHLLEGAVFNEDEMRAMAAHFTEADLLRFFNSLAETEASLREAVHPRYVLEVGLIKLIEMRSVATIESILERLNALSTGVPTSAKPDQSIAASASADIVSEKKTLKAEAPEPPKAATQGSVSQFPDQPSDEDLGFDHSSYEEPVPDTAPAHTAPATPQPAMANKVAAPPIRLPSLTAEDLEHIDDQRLDDAFENKLLMSGDDLTPLGTSEKIVAELLNGIYVKPIVPRAPTSTNGHSVAAVVPAFDIAKFRNEISPVETDVEMPVLGEVNKT
jgi:DNA polymerase-3 subunit gamma/tau